MGVFSPSKLFGCLALRWRLVPDVTVHSTMYASTHPRTNNSLNLNRTHSSTSHEINKLHVHSILAPRPDRILDLWDFSPSILCGCLPLRWRLVPGATLVVPGKC